MFIPLIVSFSHQITKKWESCSAEHTLHSFGESIPLSAYPVESLFMTVVIALPRELASFFFL